MKELFSLGNLCLSDFITEKQEFSDRFVEQRPKYELKLMLEETGAVRLEKPAPMNSMYGKYWYRSGINHTMRNELKDIVESITKVVKLKENDIWLDIACNDGTMFEFMPENVIKIGVDPADNTFKNESEKKADIIIQDFFSYDVYSRSRFGRNKAKVVTVIAMFYDLDKPDIFLQDVYKVLDSDGLLVMQMSYTPLMLKQMAFDNICHEHIYYYSLFNIKTLLERNGFKIVDCTLNDINGGSFRVYIKKAGFENNFYTQPYRDVADFRIESLLEYEKTLKLDSVETWTNFFDKINQLKEQTVNFIKQEKQKGKIIWGYGASTKGNTLLQYFGLDKTLIDGIAERSTYKWRLRTAGTNIPIYSEEEMRRAKPDYLLVLPWHFINEFKQREEDYLINGGKFIVSCPKFEIIGI
jgi:ubiquinone/menaquinone biosynthesis C-methylase UbiE